MQRGAQRVFEEKSARTVRSLSLLDPPRVLVMSPAYFSGRFVLLRKRVCSFGKVSFSAAEHVRDAVFAAKESTWTARGRGRSVSSVRGRIVDLGGSLQRHNYNIYIYYYIFSGRKVRNIAGIGASLCASGFIGTFAADRRGDGGVTTLFVVLLCCWSCLFVCARARCVILCVARTCAVVLCASFARRARALCLVVTVPCPPISCAGPDVCDRFVRAGVCRVPIPIPLGVSLA